jgi:ribosomal protein S18 acetylase RimI-like enzyme
MQMSEVQTTEFQIRALTVDDRNWVAQRLDECWGSTRVVSRGNVFFAHTLPGLVAMKDGEIVGLLTYCIVEDQIEIVTLNSFQGGIGVGTALINAVRAAALESVETKYRRVWLITTNDNLKALRFYQKRGFELVAVHRNSMAEARKLKPEIPLYGIDNIPIRDEIELEIPLTNPV